MQTHPLTPRHLDAAVATLALGIALALDAAQRLPTVAAALLFTAAGALAVREGIRVAAMVVVAVSALATLADPSSAALRGAIALVFVAGAARSRRAMTTLAEAVGTDPLTGLANRRGLEQAVARAGDRAASVALFDLDRFKALNDRWGHAEGDRALALVAEVLRSGRSTDVAARIGGDELVLVLFDVEPLMARHLAERMRTAIRARCRDEGLDIDASVGVATIHDGGLESALVRADAAMYGDKKERRASCERGRPRRPVQWMIAAVALLALAHPVAAEAQHQRGGVRLHDPPPPGPPDDVRFELLGGSLAPIDTELTGRVVVLDTVFLSLSLGVGTYGDAAYALATSMGASADAAQLAHDLTSGLLSMRVGAGVRPIPGEGLELAVSYALLSHDLRLRAPTVTSATGIETEGSFVASAATLHAVHAEIGWTFRLLDHFLVRPAVGWLHVLDAQLSFDDTGTAYPDQALDALAEDWIGYAEQWGMTPTVSLSIGYLF